MKKLNYLLLLAAGLSIVSCNDDKKGEEEPFKDPIVINLESTYTADRCKVLDIIPEIIADEEVTYKWMCDNDPVNNRKDSLLTETKDLEFIALNAGTYEISLTVSKGRVFAIGRTKITVADKEYKWHIDKIMEYKPALGLKVNDIYNGDFNSMMEEYNEYCDEFGPAIELGCYGGYIVMKFDHTIVNVKGKKDIEIWSNGTWAAQGIVMVAYDRNKNGKADEDEWYEIAGSEHNKSTTLVDYELTYSLPDYSTSGKEIMTWKDNKENTGEISFNYYGTPENPFQSAFPGWIEDEIVVKGKLLDKSQITEESWGYAGLDKSQGVGSPIDLNWAIDNDGKSVTLPGIDFIKIYTATLNESNDLNGYQPLKVDQIIDLHLKQ